MATPTRTTIGAVPNVLALRHAEVSGINSSYVATDMPMSNVVTDATFDVGRFTVVDPWVTIAQFDLRAFSGSGHPAYYPMDHVFINNHNLFSRGQVRAVVLDTTLTDPDYNTDVFRRQRLAPTAIAASTNITGNVNGVDNNPLTPTDGVFIEPTDPALNWDARFQFGNPSNSPVVGNDLQSFVVFAVSHVVDDTQPWTLPGLKAELYENGVLRADLGTQYLTESSNPTPTTINGRTVGQYLVYTWNASLLGTASGDDVEVKLTGIPGANSAVYLDELAWDNEAGYAGAAGGVVYDSGWVDVADYTPSSSTDPYDVYEILSHQYPRPVRNLLLQFDNQYEGGYLVVAFRSAGYSPDRFSGITTQLIAEKDTTWFPATLDIGVVTSGRTIHLESPNGIEPTGPITRVVPAARGGETESGSSYSADSFRRREMTVSLQLTREYVNLLMDVLDYRKGNSGAFWICAESEVAGVYQQFSTLWVTIKGEPGEAVPITQTWEPGGDYLYRKGYTLTEKL